MSGDIAAYFAGLTQDLSETELRSSMSSVQTLDIGLLKDAKSSALPPDQTDENLVYQLSQGSKGSLSILFRRYSRIVRSVALKILRDEAEADDLLQEVFIFLFQKASLFDSQYGTARSWIVHVTYQRALDRRRYLRARHFYVSQDLSEASVGLTARSTDPAFGQWSIEGVWGKESAIRLRKLLSADQLMTIELYFFAGYTFQEIADLKGQSLSNIRNHYHRGLKKLRKPAFASKLRSW